MNTIPHESCPKCGKPVSPQAFEGLCPECLLQPGFGTVTAEPGGEKLGGFVPPTPEELAKYFPQLEILGFLGRGGMGAVYKARQTHLDRIVALKILPHAVSQTRGFAERFVREARALAKLHHPNIVTLYESGQSGELFYFLMEFVDGRNLRQLLAMETFRPKDALAIVPQICDALQFAHDRGIVHCDIKPENILLNKAGQVKLADFGVAKLVAGETAESSSPVVPSAGGTQTEMGKIAGTPEYMAPEQLVHPQEVDHRSDIYALGVVFYQMLTGELPVGQFEPPSRKVRIDVRLDEVVLRALEKKPELRYQQASALKTQVQTIAGELTEPKLAAPPIPQAPRNNRWGLAALILCLGAVPLMLLCGLLFPTNWRLLLVGVVLLEIAALVLGILGWRSIPGKIATILSTLFLLTGPVAGALLFFLAKPHKVDRVQSEMQAHQAAASANILPDFDLLWDYRNPATTETKFTALLSAAETAGNRSYYVELLTQIARAQGLQGQFEQGHATLDRAAAMLAEDMKRPRARLLLERGRLFNSAGEPSKAYSLFEQARKAATESNAANFEIDAVHMLAIAASTPAEQIRWNLKGIEMVAAEPSRRGWLNAFYNNLGEAYAAAGDFPNGLKAFQQLAALRAQNNKSPDPFNLKDQSRMLRQMGRVDEAMAIIQPVWEEFSRDKKKDGWIDAEYAECLAAVGRLREASPLAAGAYDELKEDPWVKQNDPALLPRLQAIALSRASRE